MKGDGTLAGGRAVHLISRAVFIELVRRRDFYVLLMLMSLYVVGVLVVRSVGIDNASTGTFLLNLGMSLASIPAHILTLLVAARQVPEELENRTIYPLLAKPIERFQFIAGKWLACAAAGTTIYLVLTLMAWACTPKMEFYSAPMLAQAVALQALSLSALAAFAMALSLLVPRVMAVTLSAGVVFLGSKAAALAANSTRDEAWGKAVSWALLYLPDFSKLNLVTRYTDGIGPLGAWEFAGLAAYALVVTAFFLAVAVEIFRRRTL